MNGATPQQNTVPSVTTTPTPQAKPRQIPFMWIVIAAMTALGFGVGALILSPSPAATQEREQKQKNWNPPSGLSETQRYGYTGGNNTHYAVAHPLVTPQPPPPYDARTVADKRLLATTNPATNEAAIMESHPTPAWAAAAAVPATPEAIHVAVIYDTRQNDRPALIADSAVHYAVPPISGAQPSNAVRIAAIDGSTEMVMPDVESTPGPVTIPAGSRIAAMLDGAVDSDLQGPVRAHVTTDVCDPRTGAVAIPRGSWLLGQQGGGIINGTRHLGITWTRLTYPDLTSRLLIGTDTLDREGHSGIAGRPNVSGFQTFRNTLTSSLAGAAGQIASQAASSRIGGGATVVVDAPSAVNVAGPTMPTRQQSWTVERNTVFLLYLERDFDRASAYRGERCGS